MSQRSTLKTLFIAQIFFGLFDGILTNEDIFKRMSREAKQEFFGTEDGSVPEYEIAQPLDWQQSKKQANPFIKIPFTSFGETTIIYLKLIDDQDLIGPRTTGLWLAEHNPKAYNNVSYTPSPDIFARIGDFHLYQNTGEGAALTMFKFDDPERISLVGVIRDIYTVKTLPTNTWRKMQKRSLDQAGKAASTNFTNNRHGGSSPALVIFRTPKKRQIDFSLRNDASLTSRPTIDIEKRRRRDLKIDDIPDVVFPKLLVSADYHSVMRYPYDEKYIVMDLIAYFNMADMIYRQIDNPRIRLTITGIILPKDELATPYISRNTTDGLMIADQIIETTSNYFLREKERFPHDNYDIVVAMVKDSMWKLDKLTGKTVKIAGTATTRGACWRRYNTAAVAYRNTHRGVITLVHELGHLFNLDHDDSDGSIQSSENVCIMSRQQNDYEKLCWTIRNRSVLRSFFRSAWARCMHKRPNIIPDTVNSMPGTWLSLHGQCQNRFNEVFTYCYAENSCQYYGCSDEELCVLSKDSPMYEGSMHPDGRRCINETWMERV